MGNIYARAVITFIAAAGDDASYGLPGMGSVPRKGQAQETFHGLSFIQGNPLPHESVKASKWAERGWTLQEGFLSPRRLIFTDYEVHFLCNEMLFSESWKYDPPEDTLTDNINDFDTMVPETSHPKSTACFFVKELSRRTFSFDSDVLDGFIGIMNALEMTCGLKFLWGTPIDPNGLYLGWYHDLPATRRKEFPSWSPLGWKGPLNHGLRGNDHDDLDWQNRGIRVGDGHEIQFFDLESMPSFTLSSLDAPRYLHWTAKVANARVTEVSGEFWTEVWLASGEYELVEGEVKMDGMCNEGDHFLLMNINNGNGWLGLHWLLERQGAFWERIGVVHMNYRVLKYYSQDFWGIEHDRIGWKKREIIIG